MSDSPAAPAGEEQEQTQTVRYERHGATARVTIDRPERRNAVDGPTAAAPHKAYERFEAEEDARAMVLTGAGELAFCAGADLKAIDTFAGRLMAAEGPMGFTRLTPSKPTIAAISGFCLAGVPLIDGSTQRTARIVGRGRALDLILTGRIIDA